MTSIHSLKSLINILPYLGEDTWYMLGAGILVYVIYIAYLVAFERYYQSQQSLVIAPSLALSIREKISELPLDDIRFFEKLSLLVRSYLEEMGIIPLATKKTQKEIEQSPISGELKAILKTCAHYEYTKEESTEEEKEEMIRQLSDIL